MEVHTFFVAFVVFLMGVLCLTSATELIKRLLFSAIEFPLDFLSFGETRLIFQFFVYSPKLWRGKQMETIMHMLFSVLWIYLTTIFFLIYLR